MRANSELRERRHEVDRGGGRGGHALWGEGGIIRIRREVMVRQLRDLRELREMRDCI